MIGREVKVVLSTNYNSVNISINHCFCRIPQEVLTSSSSREVKECEALVTVYNCVDCVIQVNGKANNITLDKCRKTGRDLHSSTAQLNLRRFCQNSMKAPSVSQISAHDKPRRGRV